MLFMAVGTFACWNAAFGVVRVADKPGQRWGLEQLVFTRSSSWPPVCQRPSSMDSTPPNAPRPARGGAGTSGLVGGLVELGLLPCALQLLESGNWEGFDSWIVNWATNL
ncbi:hypothetical protein PVAP13_5KG575107 [Panicum virgatum]|uniref:Uncharacterized protein n=1 Tax=Panicum virgatum TaxID=38727 RepID=A0A8T0SWJ4_PANVG|nr:hypothetical protein PVAP13_5KG575107 [Panicum virgatum]